MKMPLAFSSFMLVALKEIMLFHWDPVVVVRLPFRGETMFQQEIPLTREKGPVHRNEAPPDLITCY
jgi:hypothetical protein